MEIIADLHTHTIASSHAFSTMNELVREGARQGLRALAVTDHGTAMPDAPHKWYFKNIRTIPSILDGIPGAPGGFLLLKGVEANVIDKDGGLDMKPEVLDGLDWVIASLHKTLMGESLPKEDVTRIWLNVAENPRVDMIGHPEQFQFPFEHARVAKAFAANDKIVEINCASPTVRPGNEQIIRDFAICCRGEGVKVAVTSDAHSVYGLDVKRWGIALLEDIAYPEELVVNSSLQRLCAELKSRHKPAAASLSRLDCPQSYTNGEPR